MFASIIRIDEFFIIYFYSIYSGYDIYFLFSFVYRPQRLWKISHFFVEKRWMCFESDIWRNDIGEERQIDEARFDISQEMSLHVLSNCARFVTQKLNILIFLIYFTEPTANLNSYEFLKDNDNFVQRKFSWDTDLSILSRNTTVFNVNVHCTPLWGQLRSPWTSSLMLIYAFDTNILATSI